MLSSPLAPAIIALGVRFIIQPLEPVIVPLASVDNTGVSMRLADAAAITTTGCVGVVGGGRTGGPGRRWRSRQTFTSVTIARHPATVTPRPHHPESNRSIPNMTAKPHDEPFFSYPTQRFVKKKKVCDTRETKSLKILVLDPLFTPPPPRF